ncbi:hypothetical protein ACHAQJ_009195 [Trichoderma viride]
MSRRLLIARPGHIYLATYDPTSPTITIDLDVPVAGNPSWIAVWPPNPNLLYAIDENAATTMLFELDLASNRLTKVAQRNDGSKGVCHLEFNKRGTMMIGSSWASGTIDIWNTTDGSLEFVKTISVKDPVLDAGRVSRIHQAVLDPTGRYFMVNDFGTDTILVLDSSLPDAPVVNRVSVPTGSGPRHGVFYQARWDSCPATHYMVLCETSNRVILFVLEHKDGKVEFETSHSCPTFMLEDSSPERISTAAAGEIVMSKDWAHLYTSNRLTTSPTDTIAHFRNVDGLQSRRRGALRLEIVAETSTLGKHPRMFSLSKDGGELFVGNLEGEWAVVVLKIRDDGTLVERPVAGIRMEDLVKGEGDQRGPMFVMEIV